MPADLTVAQPAHPLPQLTTYELRDYRRDLETAIARSASRNLCHRPGPSCRSSLTR